MTNARFRWTVNVACFVLAVFAWGLGFALNGASVGGMIIPPILVWLTESYGHGVAMLAIVTLLTDKSVVKKV